MPRGIHDPNVRLASPSVVTVTSGQCSAEIDISGCEEWRVKRLASSSGDVRYEQDGTPTESAGYQLTAEDSVSEWHDCKGSGATYVKVFAIAGDVDVEIGKKVRA